MNYLLIPIVIGSGLSSSAPLSVDLPNFVKQAMEGHVDGEDKIVDGRIIPAEISSYHPGYYWGTFIYLKGGQVLLSSLEVESFEVELENFHKQA